jgi:hypothetical protein
MTKEKWKVKWAGCWRLMTPKEFKDLLEIVRLRAAQKLARRVSTSKHRSEPFDY